MKSRHFLRICQISLLGLFSVALAACADGSDTAQAPQKSSQESVAAASLASAPSSAASPVENVNAIADATVSEPLVNNSASENLVREFNPADFPDSCNDYVDEVLQCIKVMDETGMEGTASMQMQLSEMQASWLKETDKQTLNQTCQLALMDIEPVLQDLGC